MSLVLMDLRAAIKVAAPDKLAQMASALAKAYGAKKLTEAEYEQLDGLLAARRRVAQAIPTRGVILAAACAQVLPAPSPAQAGGAAPARAHARTGSRPRSPESMARRRHWAAAGFLPPKVAGLFTPGEQAVLAVVGRELAAKGFCTLAQGHIAALAGVSVDTAKRALKQAALVGLVDIEVRRIVGYRNDTNRITLASREWGSWLRLRLPRSARPDLLGGGQFSASTDTDCKSRGQTARFGGGQGRPAGPHSPIRHHMRAADA